VRNNLGNEVSLQLTKHFGDKVFRSIIPRNVRLAEAPTYGLPGVVFDPPAKGSQAFVAFAQELLEKMPPASALAPEAAAPPVPAPMDAPPVAVQLPDSL